MKNSDSCVHYQHFRVVGTANSQDFHKWPGRPLSWCTLSPCGTDWLRAAGSARSAARTMDVQQVAELLHPAITLEQLKTCFNASTVEVDVDAFLSRGSGPYAEAVAAAHAAASPLPDDDASLALAMQLEAEEAQQHNHAAESAAARAAASASPLPDDDASLALAMQLEAEEEQRSHSALLANHVAGEDASAALAWKLQRDDEAAARREGAASAMRRSSKHRSEALRDHLFFSGGTLAAGTPCQLPLQPPCLPPPIAGSSGPSYAMVTAVGDRAGDRAGDRKGSARSSAAPGSVLAPNLLVAADPGPAPVPRPPRALPPPVLIIDGANVAFNYSRDARFEARGIRLCVDYYLRRTTGRRLHAAEMAVILNENRWDAADPELAYVDQLGCISRISRHGHPCMQVLTTAPSPPFPPGASHSHPRASTTTSSYSSAALITARGP